MSGSSQQVDDDDAMTVQPKYGQGMPDDDTGEMKPHQSTSDVLEALYIGASYIGAWYQRKNMHAHGMEDADT